jgi:hypothetical protein
MWRFRRTHLAQPEDFPAVVDALTDKLRSAGFVIEADQLHHFMHELIATVSTEIYGELKLALKRLDHEHRALPREAAAEVHRLIKSIDKICH